MNRTQLTKFGMLHAGVGYTIDCKTPDDEKVLKNLLNKEFAVETSEKELRERGAKLNAAAGSDADAKAKVDADAKAKG
ncbi:hypothetical protein [Roseovarius sp. MMSF_3281]|uniref:hypothetical protein n=1 Tax=Roseovarius sp. MMSF_3281 TaxID=3046694 RepID=UPI00273F72C7|nr:hypothetical protein [Roseovarius sp. MMSF_3281]